MPENECSEWAGFPVNLDGPGGKVRKITVVIAGAVEIYDGVLHDVFGSFVLERAFCRIMLVVIASRFPERNHYP